jgi:hypothetical protein
VNAPPSALSVCSVLRCGRSPDMVFSSHVPVLADACHYGRMSIMSMGFLGLGGKIYPAFCLHVPPFLIPSISMAPLPAKRKRRDSDVDDDEYAYGFRQILPVANLPLDFDGEPMDGMQYLFTVR